MARARVGAWVIVRKHDPCGPVPYGVRNDGADGEGRVAGGALMVCEVQALPPIVQMRHPQALASRVGLGQATRKERAGGFRSIQLERLFGTLIAHPIQLCRRQLRHDSNRVGFRGRFIHNGCSLQACLTARAV